MYHLCKVRPLLTLGMIKSHQAIIDFFFFLAYEILGNKLKRRSYDSVDPQFDNDVPPADEESKKNFFKVFGPVFERNSR